LRIDQLMAFNWKFLVPLSLANLVVVPLADRLAQGLGLSYGSWPWALVMLAFNLAMIWVAFAWVGTAGRRARRAVEAPAESHDESGHDGEHVLTHDAEVGHAPAAAGAH